MHASLVRIGPLQTENLFVNVLLNFSHSLIDHHYRRICTKFTNSTYYENRSFPVTKRENPIFLSLVLQLTGNCMFSNNWDEIDVTERVCIFWLEHLASFMCSFSTYEGFSYSLKIKGKAVMNDIRLFNLDIILTCIAACQNRWVHNWQWNYLYFFEKTNIFISAFTWSYEVKFILWPNETFKWKNVRL